MTTLVYKYGLLAPVAEGETVRQQMRAAHQYRNALTAVERERRTASRDVERSVGDLEELRAAFDAAACAEQEAKDLVKAARSKSRARSETASMREAVKDARAVKKAAREAWSAARLALREDPTLVASRKEIWKRAAEQTRAARAANGLHWGTGAVVDEAMKAASKEPLFKSGEPVDPRFVAWRGEGSIGIQVHQKGADETGLSVDDVMTGTNGADRWLRVSACSAGAQQSEPRSPAVAAARLRNAARHEEALRRGGGRSSERVALSVRIGTRDDKTPLMACWPMIMHRPLPKGAIVKRITVHLRRVGPREEWTCQITLAIEGTGKLPAPRGGGAVAVDLGWLSQPDGLRVATWIDARGMSGTLVLGTQGPTGRAGGGCASGFTKANKIRSIRDKGFDAALEALVVGLREIGMPEWMRALTVKREQSLPSEAQALAYLSAWKSPGRLASLAIRWREARFDGDGAVFEALEAWRYHDHHLWAWESSQRKKSERRRQNDYRVFAAELASAYETLIIGDANYAEMSRRPSGSTDPVVAAADANRTIASPGSLRMILSEAFAMRVGTVTRVACANLSVTCPACAESHPAHRDDEVHEMVCAPCGFHRDLDTTMCLNMLRVAGHADAVAAMIHTGREIGTALRRTPGGQGDEQAAE